MSKRLLYITIVLLLCLTSCRNYICPAYESAFNRGTTPYDKYFAFLPNDTLPRDERMLTSPKFFDYFDKDSAYIPTGEVYLADNEDSLTSKSQKVKNFVKDVFTDNRQEKFRNGEGKITKKGIQKKRLEDLVALYTPIKGRKNIQRRNHSNVVRSFPTLPVEEVFVIDTPTLDVIDEPFLVVDEDSLLLDLQPEDTTLVASNDKEKIDPFPPMGFDQWYYEQEFGYLLEKDSSENIPLDTLTQDMMELDSIALEEPEQKGIKGLFKKITGKFKKKEKLEIDEVGEDEDLTGTTDDTQVGTDTQKKKKKKKKKKKLNFKNPFKKKKDKSDGDDDVIEGDDVFDDDDLEDLGDDDDDTGGDGG